MRRCLFAVSFVLCLAPALLAARIERPDIPTDPDALFALANRVVTAANARLVNGPQGPSVIGADVHLAVEPLLLTLDARRDALTTHGLAYTAAQTEVTLVSTERSARSARLRVLERTTFALHSDAAGAPPETIVEREHVIDCARTPHGWIAVADTIQDDDALAPASDPSVDPHVVVPAIAVDDSVMHDDASVATRRSGWPVQALGRTYDRSAVAWYARRWVGTIDSMSTSGYNPNYVAYYQHDCSNFASQSIAWGGFPQVKGFYWLASSWWYDTWAWPRIHTDSWSIANTLKAFFAQSSRVTLLSSIRDLRVGDVLQADWEGDGWVDHSAIVTGRDSNGNIWLTYHSYNKKDIPFWDFDAAAKSRNKNVKYYRWHLADAF
ncbi:MAG TPA: amidase domain-containing protein [Thermoanaerobaculia bacterium]|nr:amidase domain-containing protein [Thermoanaerobaculia bacterium]